MKSLIAELEAATEGSRELDDAIWLMANRQHWFGKGWRYDLEFAANYTTSLDAALTLVPEGWSLANLYDAIDQKDRPWVGAILRRDEPRYSLPEKVLGAPTYALALCIASLKARLVMEAP